MSLPKFSDHLQQDSVSPSPSNSPSNSPFESQAINPIVQKISNELELINKDYEGLDSTNYEFQFTRHAMSCNNIYFGKFFNKDFEPSLAIYGILTAIAFSKKNKEDFKSDKVIVSNLLRTWITAVLLYGTDFNEKMPYSHSLHLFVSPYLKEKKASKMGITFKRGNYPKKFRHTIHKFLKFLNRLKEFDTLIKCAKSRDTDIKPYLEIIGKLDDTFYDNLPNKIRFSFPPSPQSKEPQQFFSLFKNQENEYVLDGVCRVYDTFGPNTNMTSEFLATGNLVKFMSWFRSNKNYYKQDFDVNELIPVITHSSVMRTYFINNFGIDLENDHNEISESNCWKFRTKIPKIENGIPMNIHNDTKSEFAKGLETLFTKKNLSLCGNQGSVKVDLDCQDNKLSKVYKMFRGRGGKKSMKRIKKTKNSKKSKKFIINV